jgi:uncharacterized protein YndB with AHSA1/START domain
MAHASESAQIDRPITEVFDFLADGTTTALWRSGIVSISKASGDGVGAVYRQRLNGPMGRQIDGDYRITAFDRPTRIAFEVIAGPARPTGTYELRELSPTSTAVTFSLNLEPRGLTKLMAPMISRQMEREVAAVHQLKAVLEKPAWLAELAVAQGVSALTPTSTVSHPTLPPGPRAMIR